MKENQIESCQKCLLVKTYECTKKASRAGLVKRCSLLKIDMCVAAKHKIILFDLK